MLWLHPKTVKESAEIDGYKKSILKKQKICISANKN